MIKLDEGRQAVRWVSWVGMLVQQHRQRRLWEGAGQAARCYIVSLLSIHACASTYLSSNPTPQFVYMGDSSAKTVKLSGRVYGECGCVATLCGGMA